MKLIDIISKRMAIEINCDLQMQISSLACSEKDIKEGCLFFCFEGATVDSHTLYKRAIEKGAICFITEKPLLDTPYIMVKDSRKAMSFVAKHFYGCSADRLNIVTIIGTNGKTTTSHLVENVFKACGYRTGLIGTCGVVIDGVHYDSDMTTPDPINLHKIFLDMENAGVTHVVMEASAHSIHLEKLYGIKAACSIFTNFSQDHLDYFKTIANYKKAKTNYFCGKNTDFAIINADDEVGLEIAKNSDMKYMTYSLNNKADIGSINIKSQLDGSEFILNYNGHLQTVFCHLAGNYNISNCLAACGVGIYFGIDLAVIAKGIYATKSVDGRFSVLHSKDGYNVIIDYAHTPDGMSKILKEAKNFSDGKIITIFGCGGNRDKSKRRLMGNIACSYSDLVVLTSDNPRYEEPMDIITDIQRGIENDKFYMAIENRQDAIQYAMSFAGKGDIVLVLGKGHETYQEIKGVKRPFSDFDAVNLYLE